MTAKNHIEKKQKLILWSSILAAGSHAFCCVLPFIFSILALLSGFGMVVTLPGWLNGAHENLHQWELPIIIFSGLTVGLGWIIQIYSWKIDCHDSGCAHGSCEPRKKRASKILILASALFILNCALYFGLHTI